MTYAERHSLPYLGAGIGLRREFYAELPGTERRLDWVEIIPENFLTFGGRSQAALDATRERWRVLPHGTALNVGGPDPLDDEYLEKLAALVKRLDAPFFSDHLCYSRLDGVYLHDLLPLPFTEAAVEHVVPRVREVMRRIERPFLLENPSYYARMPGQTLDEAAFLRAVVEEADCGLLLDVNNVYVNAQNHGYDPRAFIDALPLERVVQVHLAGHERTERAVIDTHGAPVPAPVWDALPLPALEDGPAQLARRVGPAHPLARRGARRGRPRAGAASRRSNEPRPVLPRDGTLLRRARQPGGRGPRGSSPASGSRSTASSSPATSRRPRQAVPPLPRRARRAPLVDAESRYYATRPARHFEVNRDGRRVPRASSRTTPTGCPHGSPRSHASSGADFAVYAHEAEIPSTVDRLQPNPTLTALEHPFRLCAYVAAPKPRPDAPEPGDELALLWRHPRTHATTFLAADDRALLALKLAVEGRSFEEAAAPTGLTVEQLEALVAPYVADGLLLGPGGVTPRR